MSSDKVVKYVDVILKDLVPKDLCEELIALHYHSIVNAKEQGRREGIIAATNTKKISEVIPTEENNEHEMRPMWAFVSIIVVVLAILGMILH